jgi:hypothetical protein
VRQNRFRALVTFDPAAGGHLGGLHASCLVQPGHGKYFPAAISCNEIAARPGVRAAVNVALADGEAGAFFALGQRFTIWADAVIGQTIRADGLVGSGVIFSRVSVPARRADNDGPDEETACPAREDSPAAVTGRWSSPRTRCAASSPVRETADAAATPSARRHRLASGRTVTEGH